MLLDAFEEITVVPDDLQSIWAADQERGLGHDASPSSSRLRTPSHAYGRFGLLLTDSDSDDGSTPPTSVEPSPARILFPNPCARPLAPSTSLPLQQVTGALCVMSAAEVQGGPQRRGARAISQSNVATADEAAILIKPVFRHKCGDIDTSVKILKRVPGVTTSKYNAILDLAIRVSISTAEFVPGPTEHTLTFELRTAAGEVIPWREDFCIQNIVAFPPRAAPVSLTRESTLETTVHASATLTGGTPPASGSAEAGVDRTRRDTLGIAQNEEDGGETLMVMPGYEDWDLKWSKRPIDKVLRSHAVSVKIFMKLPEGVRQCVLVIRHPCARKTHWLSSVKQAVSRTANTSETGLYLDFDVPFDISESPPVSTSGTPRNSPPKGRPLSRTARLRRFLFGHGSGEGGGGDSRRQAGQQGGVASGAASE